MTCINQNILVVYELELVMVSILCSPAETMSWTWLCYLHDPEGSGELLCQFGHF